MRASGNSQRTSGKVGQYNSSSDFQVATDTQVEAAHS